MTEGFDNEQFPLRPEDEDVETLALIALGAITTEDVLDAREQFGLLESEEEIPNAEEPPKEIDRNRELLESAFSDIGSAANVLGDALHWGEFQIEELATRLREAILEAAAQNADVVTEEWAATASAPQIITYAYDWAMVIKEADEV